MNFDQVVEIETYLSGLNITKLNPPALVSFGVLIYNKQSTLLYFENLADACHSAMNEQFTYSELQRALAVLHT